MTTMDVARSASKTTAEWRFFAAAVVLLTAGCARDEGPSGPLGRVIDEVLAPLGLDEDNVLVYGMDDPLQPGDVVIPHGPEDEPIGPREIERPTWMFWVDLEPGLNFAHETMFVYIDAESGELVTENHSWFPVVNDEPFWNDSPVYGDVEQVRSAHVPDLGLEVVLGQVDPPRADVDPCRGTRHAIVIGGFDDPYGYLRAGLVLARDTFSAQGYQVHEVDPKEKTPQQIRDGILAAFKAVDDTKERIDELVVYYHGHGWKHGGWILGAAGEHVFLPDELAALIKPLDTDEVTIIGDHCYSGKVGDEIDEIWKNAGIEDKHVHVLSSASATQKASVKAGGGPFTQALMPQLAAQTPGERVPWETFEVPELEVVGWIPGTKKETLYPQTAQTRVVAIPVIDEYQDPETKECWVGHITSQQYDRRINLRGHGFGKDKGTVQMQDPYDAWLDIKVDYWRDDAITIYVPMRSDGFPHDDRSGFVALATPNGHYNVRVTRPDGIQSKTLQGHYHFIHIVLQEYWQDWRANFPDMVEDPPGYRWVEMWHHLTDEPPEVTKGPTIARVTRTCTR